MTMSPQREAKVLADIDVLKSGANKVQNRGIYELYNSKSVANAASSMTKQQS